MESILIISNKLKISLAAAAMAVSGGMASAATVVIEATGQFIVPDAVDSITVLLIGGGGGGAGTHWGGGGSGYLAGGTFSVTAGDVYNVMVGEGGGHSGCAGNSCFGGEGGTTIFGNLLMAAGGGSVSEYFQGGGAGGSGGGGAGNAGFGGIGGAGGTDGEDGRQYPGGQGQGIATWNALLGLISEQSVTAGAGGLAGESSHAGGGGGGGILIDGLGLTGGDGFGASFAGATGGIGYGAGGGSGGYQSGMGYQMGGAGADGVVIVQYADTAIAPVPLPASFGMLLAGCGSLLLRRRRKAA